MAAKVFFLFVAVLVLFEAQAAFYRREFFDPKRSLMRDLMNDDDPISLWDLMNDDDPISLRGRSTCNDEWGVAFCSRMKSLNYCESEGFFLNPKNFKALTTQKCKKTCGKCYK